MVRLFLLSGLLLTSGAMAQEPALDDLMGGFEDPAPVTDTPVQKEKDTSWNMTGSVTLSAVANVAHQAPDPGGTDHRGLSRLRSKVNLKLKGDLSKTWRLQADGYAFQDFAYGLGGGGDYPASLRRSMETDKGLNEAFVQGRLSDKLDVTFGRQIVVWGKSDNIRVTDVLNPLDLREPGMVDIRDLRLGLAMAKADYYLGDWTLTGLVIPEIRFHRPAPEGSDFRVAAYTSGTEEVPGSGMDNAEWGASLKGSFSGWDTAFYLASHYNDAAYTAATRRRHARLTMAGADINLAVGNWLLKGEGAVQDGLRFTALPERSFTRADVLLGFDYTGFSETTLTLEIADAHLFGYDTATGALENDWQTAIRYQGNFMHDQLHLNGVMSLYGLVGKGGGYGRVSAAYDILDALTVTGGAVIYGDGNKVPYSLYGENDRLFLDLKYSF